VSNPPSGVQGITEADIANYLANTPGFFERHAELLAAVQLTSPHGQRAVSLQERQMEMLRERIKGLELQDRRDDPPRPGERGHRRPAAPLDAHDPADAPPVELPLALVAELRHQFLIPQAALRLWGVDAVHADQPFAQPVSEDVKAFAASLSLPYCGVNAGFEATHWLEDAATVMSLAMIPLRQRRRSLRAAGAGLARPHALQRRDGHRIPDAHRRDLRRGPVAPAARGLMRVAGAAGRRCVRESRRYRSATGRKPAIAVRGDPKSGESAPAPRSS
jgi:uncharacterized protein